MIPDNQLDLIEQYLSGKLAGKSLTDFQNRMELDKEFADEVSFMADMKKGIKAVGRKELKAELADIISKTAEKEKPQSRNLWIRNLSIAASFLILCGISFWLFLLPKFQQEPNYASVINNQAVPLSGINIPSEFHYINNERTTSFRLKTGEYLSIPKGTFIDKKGNPIASKISMSCNGFNNLLDVFVEGIPTAYDSVGEQMYLKTESILKISAIASSELNLDVNKPIQVIVPIKDTANNYHIYKLDTIRKRWIAYTPGTSINLNKFNEPATNIIKPRLEDITKRRFKIMIDEKRFPELAAYKNYIFEIAPEELNYNPEDEKIIWKNIVVNKGLKGEPYQITLKADTRTVTYKAIPVFSKEYYETALRIYQEEVNKTIRSKYQGEELHQYELAQKINSTIIGASNKGAYRIFYITEPGIYADSKLVSYNPKQTISASFEDKMGNPLTITQLAIADFSSGILYRLKAGKTIDISIDKPQGKAILAVTSDNQLAYLTEEEFNKLNTSHTAINLNVMDISNDNYPKLKRIFGDKGIALVLSFLTKK